MISRTPSLAINSTTFQVTEFILLGFPGFLRWQHWFSIPLTLFLLAAVVANITLVLAICREQNLHEPMYYFLCKLAVVDLSLSMVTTPKILVLLWFDATSISLTGCFTQMFFVHWLVLTESGIFVAMAFDRYVAVCNPLRYHSIVNKCLVVKFILVIIGRSLAVALPVPFLAARLNYCSEQIVKYSYCNNLAVTKLACDDISLNSMYQLTVANSVLGGDFLLICVSYCLILHAVLQLNAVGAMAKAFSTCSSHVIVILISYSALIVIAITHISDSEIMTCSAIILNVLLLIVPPALNPIVYGIRNKEINLGIRKRFSNLCC
ncbi:olfactory receptor 56A4-like [Ambystoma mexicanum]|uniref:olfactory receptor 56A4-like n=1 Tax=Ambystoma mexicanum TaxID=8296 RepID=UPI0037E94F9E